MTPVTGTSRHEICQVFSGVSNPRFKIDRHGDWSESYPAQDHGVADDTSQHITFDAVTHAVTAQAVASCVNELGSGISFVRDFGDGQSYAVVGLAAGGDRSFTVSGIRNGTYRDAVTGNIVTVTGGQLSFTVRGSSAGIYVLDGPGKIGVDGAFLR